MRSCVGPLGISRPTVPMVRMLSAGVRKVGIHGSPGVRGVVRAMAKVAARGAVRAPHDAANPLGHHNHVPREFRPYSHHQPQRWRLCNLPNGQKAPPFSAPMSQWGIEPQCVPAGLSMLISPAPYWKYGDNTWRTQSSPPVNTAESATLTGNSAPVASRA